ncbi:TetR/AcrR family transcriptional regulator [Neptunicella sp. SCSIO 80796]|uniref:TetR/AcrR family transcriptional regulator n=1 Tax=Neptunicella plasticusilytica TaxID=3117012 RepID=UPI003A4E0F27
MPRKALYNLDDVLSQAIDVFLEYGYHGAIMEELIARTDFNRRGFYLEFGSKLSFFYKVVEYYQTRRLAPVMAHLDDNQGMISVSLFFKDYVQLINGRGCLLVSAITELGFDNEHIRDVGRHYLDQLQIGFIGCLEKALQHQQIRAGINIESTALQLTSYVQGFAVNAVLASGTDELTLATNALLGPLEN